MGKFQKDATGGMVFFNLGMLEIHRAPTWEGDVEDYTLFDHLVHWIMNSCDFCRIKQL